jgi:hypothetical protein
VYKWEAGGVRTASLPFEQPGRRGERNGIAIRLAMLRQGESLEGVRQGKPKLLQRVWCLILGHRWGSAPLEGYSVMCRRCKWLS